MSDLLNLLALIIIAGVILWLINAFIPMPAMIKSLLNIVVFLILIIYVLQYFGLVHTSLPTIRLFK